MTPLPVEFEPSGSTSKNLSSLIVGNKFWLFFRHWQNILAILIIGFFGYMALDADRWAPNPDIFWASEPRIASDPHNIYPHPPSALNPLGTIVFSGHSKQIDILTALVRGTHSALIFGLTAAIFTGLIGTTLGALSGYLGGWVNTLIMRITDSMLAVPVLVGIFLINQILLITAGKSTAGNQYSNSQSLMPVVPEWLVNWFSLIDPVWLAIILFSWMPYSRLINGIVLTLKKVDFVEAARAVGASPIRIIFRHILPNAISPVIILLTRDIGGMVVLQTTFGFIGIGGNSQWGLILLLARNYMVGTWQTLMGRWWVFLPAIITITLFGIGWSLLGDGLNDWLNPKTEK